MKPETPPTFIALCADDPFIVPGHALRFVEAAKKVGAPVEFHYYAKGGHGFGVREIKGGGAGAWPLRLEEWLKATFASPQSS